MEVTEELRWFLGALGSIMAVGLSLWWKVENSQNKKIDRLGEQNAAQHEVLFKRINGVENKLTDQHITILGKIEELWKSRLDK